MDSNTIAAADAAPIAECLRGQALAALAAKTWPEKLAAVHHIADSA
ncbi:MAG TPA: DUF455 domain-containing protein, partial [Achromobacter sp.]|nr:DUF455 domain-containing protein [Achromobacter sp.]